MTTPSSASKEFYPWQSKVIQESPTYPRRALFAAPRLGKTRATAAMLSRNLTPNDTSVVLAPLSVCKAWTDELSSEGVANYGLYLHTVADAAEYLYQELIPRLKAKQPTGALVLNYDKLPGLINTLKTCKPTGVICDESHLLKNPQSSRSKAVRRLVHSTRFVRILTGTPSPNHYGDLWAQMVLINPDRWNTSWTQFARRYLIRDAVYPSKIIGHNNVPELQEMLKADADFVRREDVFGPDTYQHIERLVDMPAAARASYDALVREWLLYHEQGGEIVADHTLKRLVRLQQMSSGYLRNEHGQDYELHTAKVDAVLADLDEIVESEEKAIVFHRFTWEGETYAERIAARFPQVRVYRMAGDSSPAQRALAQTAVKEIQGPVVVVAQTRTAALGISFAEATHALFVSESFSFTDESQAQDRIYKPGFNRCITHYRCADTVDEFVGRVIANKSSIHDAVTHADIREMAWGKLKR